MEHSEHAFGIKDGMVLDSSRPNASCSIAIRPLLPARAFSIAEVRRSVSTDTHAVLSAKLLGEGAGHDLALDVRRRRKVRLPANTPAAGNHLD